MLAEINLNFAGYRKLILLMQENKKSTFEYKLKAQKYEC